jgi:hypothetical protein
VSARPAGTDLDGTLQFPSRPADLWHMDTLTCRAVARAALAAPTASLDSSPAWPLLLVAGWHTTAAELYREARETALLLGPLAPAA